MRYARLDSLGASRREAGVMRYALCVMRYPPATQADLPAMTGVSHVGQGLRGVAGGCVYCK